MKWRSSCRVYTVFFSVRKRSDCSGGFGTVSARFRESKAQWPTFGAASVYVCEWASVCVRPRLECVCVCAYICRENVSTVAAFKKRFSAAEVCRFIAFCADGHPRGCFLTVVSRCLMGNRWHFADYFLSYVSCCVTAWGSAPARHWDWYYSCHFFKNLKREML